MVVGGGGVGLLRGVKLMSKHPITRFSKTPSSETCASYISDFVTHLKQNKTSRAEEHQAAFCLVIVAGSSGSRSSR